MAVAITSGAKEDIRYHTFFVRRGCGLGNKYMYMKKPKYYERCSVVRNNFFFQKPSNISYTFTNIVHVF